MLGNENLGFGVSVWGIGIGLGPHPLIVVYKEYIRTLICSPLPLVVTISGWGPNLRLECVDDLGSQL